MHRRSLERFPFDSVLFPYNAPLLADAAYRADVEELIGTCDERGVACQAIKATARRRWPGRRASGERRMSWYEPLTEPDEIAKAVSYVLGQPSLFLITSSDWRTLAATLEGAERRAPAPDGDALVADAGMGLEALFDGGALERI
ncbi:MAG: hypothetical protein JO368_00500 [Acidimicrobiales bacterium]|nr:hypothetical protein [Acidimicrobiales bacterium]